MTEEEVIFISHTAPPTSSKKKTKKIPFSRADYARRRQKHTDEERLIRNHLQRIFRRKFSWRSIKEIVEYSNWGRPHQPIVIA